MSDIANRGPGVGGQGPGRIIVACAIALCIVACTLIFLLPADSLVVDLVYQGF